MNQKETGRHDETQASVALLLSLPERLWRPPQALNRRVSFTTPSTLLGLGFKVLRAGIGQGRAPQAYLNHAPPQTADMWWFSNIGDPVFLVEGGPHTKD